MRERDEFVRYRKERARERERERERPKINLLLPQGHKTAFKML